MGMVLCLPLATALCTVPDTFSGASHYHLCPRGPQGAPHPAGLTTAVLSWCLQAFACDHPGVPAPPPTTLAFLRLHQRVHLQGQLRVRVSPTTQPARPPWERREKPSHGPRSSPGK
ncbi:hypothetical protein GHT09_014000 [Marmota monax]|uniref:Uncharacterized protein n=1 Tax=Marmota monax TaxID=9995 RepID=A0A834PM38_MARMO|nr:hypothetical protein GHT09_014000 [Marmota monax]